MKRIGLPLFATLIAGCGQPPAEIPATHALRADPSCNPTEKPCSAVAGAEKLTFSLAAPHPLQPFGVRADWRGPVPETVTVSFEMVGMDMGENRYRLLADGAGGWQGSAVLPVCTTGRSDWVAQVEVRADGARHVARFGFRVGS